jgi:hypothetical protein
VRIEIFSCGIIKSLSGSSGRIVSVAKGGLRVNITGQHL